jgi:Gluconate 2-dehydrogenase subunit 3
MKRREFITLPAKCLGGLLVYALAGVPVRIEAQEGMVRLQLRFFKENEARVIAAACDRIFPSDESGPGAKEAGVITSTSTVSWRAPTAGIGIAIRKALS